MKITPEDMAAVHRVIRSRFTNEEFDLDLALILTGIYNRGYADGWEDGRQTVDPA